MLNLAVHPKQQARKKLAKPAIPAGKRPKTAFSGFFVPKIWRYTSPGSATCTLNFMLKE